MSKGTDIKGESDPIKIDKNAKYGKRKKTDEERFECQRYERSDKAKSFWKSLRKKREM